MKKEVMVRYYIATTEQKENEVVTTKHKMNELYTIYDVKQIARTYKLMPNILSVRIEREVTVVTVERKVVEVI